MLSRKLIDAIKKKPWSLSDDVQFVHGHGLMSHSAQKENKSLCWRWRLNKFAKEFNAAKLSVRVLQSQYGAYGYINSLRKSNVACDCL